MTLRISYIRNLNNQQLNTKNKKTFILFIYLFIYLFFWYLGMNSGLHAC
jgi:hypothetical protein